MQHFLTLHKVAITCDATDEEIGKIAQYYDIDVDLLKTDVEIAKALYANCMDLDHETNLLEWHLNRNSDQILPRLWKLLEIYYSCPVTSASAERSFSSLKQTLTSLRQTMGQQRLRGCSMIHMNRDITNLVLDKEMDKLVDSFGNNKGKKDQLII